MDRDFHVRAAVRFRNFEYIHEGVMPEPYGKSNAWR
jgi:hypothetical protein